MKACYVDVHIHTSDNSNNLNLNYDVEKLKQKVEEISNGHNYLISLTDHNVINEDAYSKLFDICVNFIVGVELHIRNYQDCPAYHCHFLFNLSNDKARCMEQIRSLNVILNELYPNKLPELCDSSIPCLSDIIKKLEGYEYLVLPHGGQSHGTFNKSIPQKGVVFNDVMERSIYYNLFDGFTARSPKKLDATERYFKTLGIAEFINLITCTDNYSVDKYPEGKTSDEFIPTWMYSSPNFDGLRIALSEKTRLSYDYKPIDNWQEEIKEVYLNEENIKIKVKLEPGLNVVIGNSSSGKTLFVDSIYRKIKRESNNDYSKYNVCNIKVDNPSGMIPHYFSQNYITDLVKKDEENGVDNNLSQNEFLKQIFPFNKNFEQQIIKSIANLREQLTIFIHSAKNIKSCQTKINSISNFARLFYLEDKLVNPIKQFLPDKIEREKLNITDETKKDIEGILTRLIKYQGEIAFVERIDYEIDLIRGKFKNAYEKIDFANRVNNVIDKKSNSIELKMNFENSKNSSIDESKANLLENIAELIENYNSFWKAYNVLINYDVEFKSNTIISAGHSLSIKNNFRLSKIDLIENLNKYLINKIKNDKIVVAQLFEDNFTKKPKVNGYDDLIEKIMNEFMKKNRVDYEIIHKDGRRFSELSPGLRTSVLLDIIIGYNQDQAPLIIDQPEDNLATNYINGDLIKAIKECKTRKQIIIVTHNATIPMLGDAQAIIYCKNNGGVINIESYKMEDRYDEKTTILDIIAEVTDGGKSSVKKRFKKYNLKSYRQESI